MSEHRVVRVAAAAIAENGALFLQQRGPTDTFPFRWECPGGKAEGQETLAETLYRELFEENKLVGSALKWHTGVSDFTVHKRIVTTVHGPPEFEHVLEVTIFGVTLRPGVRPAHFERCVGMGWFTALEAEHLRLTPANKSAFVEIFEWVQEARRITGR